ncbi:MAG: D-alanine--D-alanine ligase [Candidatus Yanofskybacteria bacterium]|nr:D-alanine--D-alanine ligase [Candidatus Yanofskybacteria bacterium]
MNTKKNKIRVGVIFGGKSAEHEVSLQSAKNIMEAIDKDKYEVVPIGIDKGGRWLLNNSTKFLLNANDPKLIKLNNEANVVLALSPGGQNGQLLSSSDEIRAKQIDVAFPILHGTFGEDGTMQGLLKLLDVPFVGASVLGSAVGMDKDIQKRLLLAAGIPIANFLVFEKNSKINFKNTVKQLSLPFFIKPANSGSSVGISRVDNQKQFKNAVAEAFKYDGKILIEESIKGRELECSVLGNDKPIASIPGEIVLNNHDFYSYEAKYIDEKGATLAIPAKLPKNIIKKIQTIAIKSFKTLCLEGMARVDFFLRNGNEVIVNELNTIPGFTKISMYPKLWEASGMFYPELIDRLITLALERFSKEKKLKTSVDLS